jgi:hypothetical protein
VDLHALIRKEEAMPNYVYCGFSVTGNPAERERFRKCMIIEVPVSAYVPDDLGQLFPSAAAAGLKTIITFDFNGIIPIPPGLNNFEQERWAVEHSGTKWNAQQFSLLKPSSDSIDFQFDTAWDFPTPVFEALAQEFPTLIFEGYAVEEQGEFKLAGQWNGDWSWGLANSDRGAAPADDEYEEF